MDFYGSKKAILEHCWKDSKDVRWLDRAIKYGKIWICEWDYYVVSEYVNHLEEENWELENTVVSLRKQLKEKGEEKSESDDEWLKSDLDFQISENERLTEEHDREIRDITERCYNHMARCKCLPVGISSINEFSYWIKWVDISDMDSDFWDIPF